MICLTSLLDLPHGCGSRPKGPDRLVLASPLPPKFFANPKCPLITTTIKEPAAEVHYIEGFAHGPVGKASFWTCALVHRLRAIPVFKHVPVGKEPQSWTFKSFSRLRATSGLQESASKLRATV